MDLESPPYNVDRLEEIFSQCKFGEDEIEFTVIDKLVDWNATKENVFNGIVSAFADADENDVSYFYIMCHGGTKDGIPCLAPSDTKFTIETEITVHELEEALSAIAGTKVVFIESCHSGNFIDKGDTDDDDFNDAVINIFSQGSLDLFTSDQYQVLTSCKGDQVCWEVGHGVLPYSYFTMGLYTACKELKGDTNEDEIVDMSEAYRYIREWVWDNTNKDQAVQMYPDNSTFPIIEY